MKTPKPQSFAARKRRSMFSTVWFSRMLSPTSRQETPRSLRTSFWGSMTTSAVSPFWNSISDLLADVGGRGSPLHVPVEERPHPPGDLVAVRLQGEVPGVDQVV